MDDPSWLEMIDRRRRGPSAFRALVLMCALLCTPCWPLGQTLTLEQLVRLRNVVDNRGSYAGVPREVASILDLQPVQLAHIKQIAYLDEQGNRHGFAPLSDGSGYFMFRSGANNGQSVYRVDSALHLVRAARGPLRSGPLIALPTADAQRELDEEFRHWSMLLSPDGPAAAKGPLRFPFRPPEPDKP